MVKYLQSKADRRLGIMCLLTTAAGGFRWPLTHTSTYQHPMHQVRLSSPSKPTADSQANRLWAGLWMRHNSPYLYSSYQTTMNHLHSSFQNEPCLWQSRCQWWHKNVWSRKTGHESAAWKLDSSWWQIHPFLQRDTAPHSTSPEKSSCGLGSLEAYNPTGALLAA